MERLNRILRLARLRDDKAAIAIIEGRMWHYRMQMLYPPRILPKSSYVGSDDFARWTESELRAAWGDR